MALQHAAARWDPSKGTAFSTYAAASIANRMRRGASELSRPVAVPEYKLGLIHKVGPDEKLSFTWAAGLSKDWLVE